MLFLCAAVVSLSKKPDRICRIAAYNVGVFSKYKDDSTLDIARMMLDSGVDAVALCELDSCNLRHAAFQAMEFAEAMSADTMETPWSCRYGSAMQWNGGSYGTGVVTRSAMTDGFDIRLPKGNGYEPRVCVVAETASYVIAAVHLDHSSEEVRMEQAGLVTDELKRRYRRSRKPVFLCGDLNATPDSPTLSLLSKDWDVLSAPSPTYPSHDPVKCIDYILALDNRARYKVIRTEVGCGTADISGYSDHLPVFVDIRIR